MQISQRNIKIYYLSQLFHSMVFTAPIWIVFYTLRGVSEAEISLIMTFAYIMQMVWELPSGALADLIGRRTILVISFIISSLSYISFFYAEGFIWFLVLNLIMSIGDSFRSGSEEALIYDSFKQDGKEEGISKVFANASAIYQGGLIFGAIAGGILYSFNPVLPSVTYGIVLLLGAISSLLYIEPKIDSERFTLKNYWLQIVNGSKEAFSSGKYSSLMSLFYIFVGGIAWSSTLFFNESLLVDLGYSDTVRGIIGGVLRLLNILLITYVLARGKYFSQRGTILMFPIIMLIAYLPGVFLNSTVAPLFIQLAMLATTSRFIILSPVVNKVFSSKYRATALSFLSLMIGFVYVTLTGVSAYIIPEFGIKTMYTLLGVFSLLTVLPLAYMLIKNMPKVESNIQ
ncbi:MAG TPA: MFS transporter [Candidatus Dojkabacteria bacterium]|nr:MFS transporter [Candidatus Dojkabacteria bacterium]